MGLALLASRPLLLLQIMLQVSEINSVAELAGLRPLWDKLLEQTEGATFFQSLEWLETYWKFYGTTQRLRVLVVEEAGQPVGILPLAMATEPRRVGPVRVLTYPLHGWGSFYGPIGASASATLVAGLRHIYKSRRDWDLLDLRWVDTTGVDGGRTSHAMQLAGFDYHAGVWHTSAQVELDTGWESYWQSRQTRWRSNLRRCERRLGQRGRIEHVRYRPRGAAQGEANPRWDLYDHCVEIARRSWQGISTTGTTLSHRSVRDYFRAAHAAAVQAGAVDVNLLLLDGRPVAFGYNYCFRGWVYGVRWGYDQSAAQEGAGTVLMHRLIEDSCRRGDRLIDLGPDYVDCKRYWLTRQRPAYHYTHFRPTGFRAQAIRIKRTVSRWFARDSRLARAKEKSA